MHGMAIGSVEIRDDVMTDGERAALNEYLHSGGWEFGWRSRGKSDTFAFWHRHFAGYRSSKDENLAYDCADEIKAYPLIDAAWQRLATGFLAGRRLIRCYANGSTYGSDGTLHKDSNERLTYTSVYYPHPEWWPNWAGETVFFNADKTDIVGSVYPRPNRMVTFDGRIPHVARGVSRTCPKLRITLMFKTDIANE